MSEMGNFARRILAEHPDLEPGDTCVVNADGTVVRTVDLQQQLDAANQRIAELTEQRNVISGHFSHLEMCRDNATVRAEAAERKLATCRDALIEGRYGGRNQYDEACCPVCRRGLGHNGECSYGKALAQIEQPQKQTRRAEDAQTDERDYAKLAELNRLFSAPAFVRFTDPWLKDSEQLYDIVFPNVRREDGPVTITAPGLLEAQVRRYVNHPYYAQIEQSQGTYISGSDLHALENTDRNIGKQPQSTPDEQEQLAWVIYCAMEKLDPEYPSCMSPSGSPIPWDNVCDPNKEYISSLADMIIAAGWQLPGEDPAVTP